MTSPPGLLVTVDYYEIAEKLMGGQDVAQRSVRLFMIPGRSHCAEGVGAAATDMLGAMQAWVEHGCAPDRLIGAHVDVAGPYNSCRSGFLRLPADLVTARFTRPHYRFPLKARYKGTGDPNEYRNLDAVEPASE